MKRRPPNRVIGYIRVSTEDQRVGPEAQAADLERWCGAHNAKLVAVFSDLGVSGAAELDKREGLQEALSAVDAENCGTLLVAKRDRLARDTLSAAMLERLVQRSGATIKSANGVGNEDTAEALLMRRMIDAFAEYERALIRARTKAALATKKKNGERTGGIPFGYSEGEGGRLVKNQEEQATLRTIRELRSRGNSIRKIARILNQLPDLEKPRGKRWHPTTIARILRANQEEATCH